MATKKPDDAVSVLVEIPKGSRNKYEFDRARNRIRLDRMLHSSTHFPCDYGFIEDTLGEDGDPLDALVLIWEPTFPGCVVGARPIGVFDMADDKGRDHKILCVPLHDPHWNQVRSLGDVPPHLKKEIEHFFTVYKMLENKPTHIYGWQGATSARAIVRKARGRFAKS